MYLLTLGNVQLNQIRAYMVFATPTQNANQEAEPKMEIAQLDLVFAVLFRKKNMSLITYDGILMSI